MSLAVLVPVLGRPHRVSPTLDGFDGFHVLFIADPNDHEEIAALRDAGADFITHAGGYAEKIQRGVQATNEDLIFTAADDLDPSPDWFAKANAHIGNGCEVVGVNDLCSQRVQAGIHATHFLMTRSYAEWPTIDGQPGPFFQGYSHWYVDDEFVGTAQKRGAIKFALDSHVQHLHPMIGKAPDDETYRKGRADRKRDKALFNRRRHLWT